ncbi:hypothetical protein ACEUZ9_002779 [Paracoccus litorisediminis]|uniref:hypothetical protein n=1 Tax=Paracoccus litorisediminis TaxID=2006130 RepID=UPI0037340416
MDVGLYPFFDTDFSPRSFGQAMLPLTGLIAWLLIRSVRRRLIDASPLLGHVILFGTGLFTFMGLFTGQSPLATLLLALTTVMVIWPGRDISRDEIADRPWYSLTRIALRRLAPVVLIATPVVIAATISHVTISTTSQVADLLDSEIDEIDAKNLLRSEEQIRAEGYIIDWFEPEPRRQELYRRIWQYGSFDLGRIWSRSAGFEILGREPSGQLGIARITPIRAFTGGSTINNIPIWCLYRGGEFESARWMMNHRRSLAEHGSFGRLQALCPANFNTDGKPMLPARISGSNFYLRDSLAEKAPAQEMPAAEPVAQNPDDRPLPDAELDARAARKHQAGAIAAALSEIMAETAGEIAAPIKRPEADAPVAPADEMTPEETTLSKAVDHTSREEMPAREEDADLAAAVAAEEALEAGEDASMASPTAIEGALSEAMRESLEMPIGAELGIDPPREDGI